MYTITVNSNSQHHLEFKKDKWIIDSKEAQLDMINQGNGSFHIIRDLKSYNVQLISLDKETKTARIRVNENEYHIQVKDQYDELLHQLGMDNLQAKKLNEIKAPMPGLVLKVLVKDGDMVKKGENLVILEAMKMENILKAPEDLTIKSVKVNATDKVEKNQVLIILG